MTPTKIDDSQRVVPVEATDLLPCPMCTSAAEFHAIPVTEDSADENAGGVYVECSNPRCGVCTQLRFPLMEDVRPLLAETWNRRTAAPSAEPPVAPLAAAQEGVSCWRLLTPVGPQAWIDGLPPIRDDSEMEAEKRLGWSVELAYSRPPAQADHEGV